MTVYYYFAKENIEMTTLEGSMFVLGRKKIIYENKFDIILSQTVKSNTWIIMASPTDASTIYPEFSGIIR